MSASFNALVVDKQDDQFSAVVKQIDGSEVEALQVKVQVEYSSMNYKDALAVTNSAPICKSFPFIPGIDFAGTVMESSDDAFAVGDKVVCTGFGVGERYFGGLAEQVWAKSQWLTKLPDNLSAEQAMFVGTAGFTAMLCVNALLEDKAKLEQAPVLVTGATGGVGSFAVSMLAQLGYDVAAMTRDSSDYVMQLGAKQKVQFEPADKPLDKQLYSGAVDCVGGTVLAGLLTQMNYGSKVAACGLAESFALKTTVMPFILRAVQLIGVDSVYYDGNQRAQVWQDIANLMDGFSAIESRTASLEDVIPLSKELLAGQINGRIIVKV